MAQADKPSMHLHGHTPDLTWLICDMCHVQGSESCPKPKHHVMTMGHNSMKSPLDGDFASINDLMITVQEHARNHEYARVKKRFKSRTEMITNMIIACERGDKLRLTISSFNRRRKVSSIKYDCLFIVNAIYRKRSDELWTVTINISSKILMSFEGYEMLDEICGLENVTVDLRRHRGYRSERHRSEGHEPEEYVVFYVSERLMLRMILTWGI